MKIAIIILMILSGITITIKDRTYDLRSIFLVLALISFCIFF